jgi:hypothetical protein
MTRISIGTHSLEPNYGFWMRLDAKLKPASLASF